MFLTFSALFFSGGGFENRGRPWPRERSRLPPENVQRTFVPEQQGFSPPVGPRSKGVGGI